MLQVQIFTFNAFQENSYLLWDKASKTCIIIDPGCSNTHEQQQLSSFIKEKDLTPTRLINTHCHIDHVLGNQYVADKYQLQLEAHRLEKPVLESCEMVSKMYGVPYAGSPDISNFLEDGDKLEFAGNTIDILLAPGHSPGSICLHLPEQQDLIAGDVLFQGSIGRTDLPGGDYDTLITSVKTKLFPLPDETTVYPGHGPSTTIGIEKRTNPFF